MRRLILFAFIFLSLAILPRSHGAFMSMESVMAAAGEHGMPMDMPCDAGTCTPALDLDCLLHCLSSQPYSEQFELAVPVLLKTLVALAAAIGAIALALVLRPVFLPQLVYPNRLVPILCVQKRE